MSTVLNSVTAGRPRGWSAAMRKLINEALVLIDALLSPGELIAEGEATHALRKQADRIEATDPARAAQLRARASRIGMH